MLCYECSITGCPRDAIGVCSHCSVALCAEHAQLVAEEITTRIPLVKSIVLPRRARLLFCQVCKAALEQCAVGQDEGQTVSNTEAEETDLATVS
jgi:hypothetical protein